MSSSMTINSQSGPYRVEFVDNFKKNLDSLSLENHHFIIDKNVFALYEPQLTSIVDEGKILFIEPTEEAKSLDKFTTYIECLLERGVRRDHKLVAIGGGIIQDIVAFLATTLLRGVEWIFIPTTLLAQADSCIGSKSSINVGKNKNAIGTFCPPSRIFIDVEFLKSLSEVDIRSGVGEMLKVHAIAGPTDYDLIAMDYQTILDDPSVMKHYILRSLQIKKEIIEEDEFDTGRRNIMNYGHSFGHAIETATSFSIPHGIAVTIGMDFANYVAVKLGLTSQSHYDRMHSVLLKNAGNHLSTPIPIDRFLSAISRDKKNKGTELTLILLNAEGLLELIKTANSQEFKDICNSFLAD